MAQDTTDSLATALEGDSVVWRPTLYADWAADGYGAEESIDDLSGQADGYTVAQSYNDGLPDEVAYLGDSGVPGMSAKLGGRDPLNPVQYFSPFNADSPVYGYQRDTAPVKMDQGTVTEDGIETVRLFTGQMVGVPVTAGGGASISATSNARLLLSQLVRPPVREKYYSNGPFDFGLTASWPISYAMHACGVYPSPPALTGCRLWLPMHGGGNPFIPSANPYANNYTGVLYGQTRKLADTALTNRPLRHIRGPFVGSVDCQIATDELRVLIGSPAEYADGLDLFSQASNKGSVQFYIRGDAGVVSTVPGGSGQFTWGVSTAAFIAGFWLIGSGSVELVAGIDTSRRLFVKVNEGTHTATFTSTLILPQDGAWHAVGLAWDIAGNTLYAHLDGVTQTYTASPAFTTATLPATDFAISTLWAFALPPAEIQLVGGYTPSTTGYLDDTGYYTRRAYVYPSSLELEILNENVPREAWEYIGSLCNAETAALRIDENDDVYIMPRGWFATEVLNASTETITTDRDAARPDIGLDYSKIRNVVRVTYRQTRIDTLAAQILDYKTILTFPPGVTTIQLSFDQQAVRVDARSSLATGASLVSSFVHLTAAQIDGSDPSPPGGSYVTMNTSPDGSGTYSAYTDVRVDTVDWTTEGITLQFTNLTGLTWYLVNNSPDFSLDFSYIGIYGVPIYQLDASVDETEAYSVVTRGLRTLTLRIPAIQSEAAARLVARRIVLEHAQPLATVRAEVFGDPRRQPTDVVAFSDPFETGLSDTFRLQTVRHSISGAEYTQTLQMRQAYTVMVWGQSRWGRSRWAGQEVELA